MALSGRDALRILRGQLTRRANHRHDTIIAARVVVGLARRDRGPGRQAVNCLRPSTSNMATMVAGQAHRVLLSRRNCSAITSPLFGRRSCQGRDLQGRLLWKRPCTRQSGQRLGHKQTRQFRARPLESRRRYFASGLLCRWRVADAGGRRRRSGRRRLGDQQLARSCSLLR